MRTFFVALCLSLVAADVYMHNPRGSNNRLNENNTNRDNANRLFDSQNNGKGGYCFGPSMAYYESSELTIEWTAQHSCGGEGKADCQIILQYMCSDSSPDADQNVYIRDGTTTETINANNWMETDPLTGTYVYGMHESYDFFLACNTRERNMGLFIANEQINGNTARFTRQNENGNQRGFECAEERDYYPYWAPSPWVDIAIITSRTDLCDYYKDESQNNDNGGSKMWGYCEMPDTTDPTVMVPAAPNYQSECESMGYTWTTWAGHDVDNPECVEAPWARDNHLGNVGGQGTSPAVHSAHYNWTIPGSDDLDCVDTETCQCVLRLRYNISTAELDGFAKGGSLGDSEFHDFTYNGANSPFTNDPYVEIAGETLALEMNTNQYGRTFQDRSYVFNILKRPSISSLATIYNLNVRGKRGNIVQAYPSVEYDFVPTVLHVQQYDFIHFQWTGCDSNPAGNDGQGRDQTDRSNMAQIGDLNANIPLTEEELMDMDTLFDDLDQRTLMAFLGQTNCDVTDPEDQQDPQNCLYLNAAEPYFNGGLLKMNSTGTFYYMSTRNNNFSNRSHKGTIVVGLPLTTAELVGVVIGCAAVVALAAAGIAAFYGSSHPHSLPGKLLSKIRS